MKYDETILNYFAGLNCTVDIIQDNYLRYKSRLGPS
jgi:hypothetical protein